LARNKDSLSGEGKIDLSPQHKYSGRLDAWTNDLCDYVSTVPAPPRQKAAPVPVELQATIDSSQWDVRGAIHLPKSSPLSFTASFALPIGITWSAFQISPLNVSLDFPAIFLAAAPQFFHSKLLEDGILSGKISLSETLGRPCIVGEVQLVNGKLASGDFLNVIGASTLAIFDGYHASLEFLNLATKDVDLALRGEIDFENPRDLVVRISGATPIFDLTSRPVDCVNKIEVSPVPLPLAPAATQFEFRGPLFQSGWSVSLREEIGGEFSIVSTSDSAERIFSLCFGTGPEEKALLLGAVPRAEDATRETSKKAEKRR